MGRTKRSAAKNSVESAIRRPVGTPWRKGQSGNPRGRPMGLQNRITLEIRKAARALVEDPKYRASLRRRLICGRAPNMETLLFHYAYGKPKDLLEVSGSEQRPLSIRVTWGEEPIPDRNGRDSPGRTSVT